MKVLFIFDQIQAGMGGKEKANLPLGGKTTGIGSTAMMESQLKNVGGNIIATLYCGDKFFDDNKDMVKEKMVAMVKKMNPDVVICGPAYDYKGYANMCAILASEIINKTDIKALCAMSEQNDSVIAEYKNDISIVKMPKKGGIGLTESLKNICLLAEQMVLDKDYSELKNKVCY